MRTSQSSIPSHVLSAVRESLMVSLWVALASFLMVGLAHAQQPATPPVSPGWVVIPVEEYQSLRARAFPAEREPEPPPVEATLTRVDYDLRVNGELATGQASLTVDVIKDGWVRVAIPSGLLVREAWLDLAKTPYDANRPSQYGISLNVGSASQTVEVTSAAPLIAADANGIIRGQGDRSQANFQIDGAATTDQEGKVFLNKGWNRRDEKDQAQQASPNVFNLQKKVAGVLPVRVDVPRAGSSYLFARALVLDEETKLTFSYKTK
jgi:hypothetical protein